MPLVSTLDVDDATKRQTAIDGLVAVNRLVATLPDYDEEAFKGHRNLALWNSEVPLSIPLACQKTTRSKSGKDISQPLLP